MKGGYKPGGGRPKGSGDKKKRKLTEQQEEVRKVREMLALGTGAKVKFYQEFLDRVNKGEKLTIAEKKMMDQISIELAASLDGEGGVSEGLTPLEYMLRVMNDPCEAKERRDRLAIASAPFVHPRKGEGATGKKEEQSDRAKLASTGRFASSRQTIALVK